MHMHIDMPIPAAIDGVVVRGIELGIARRAKYATGLDRVKRHDSERPVTPLTNARRHFERDCSRRTRFAGRREHMKRIFTLGIALAIAAAGVANAADKNDERKKKHLAAIQATLSQLAAADASGDAVLAARQFDSDANLMPPGGPPLRGRDEIEKLYRGMSSTAVRKISIDAEETWVMDDWAASRGTIRGEATYRDGQKTRPVNDKYLMLLKRSGERWEIVSLAWNPF